MGHPGAGLESIRWEGDSAYFKGSRVASSLITATEVQNRYKVGGTEFDNHLTDAFRYAVIDMERQVYGKFKYPNLFDHIKLEI